jgi:ABC-2 type transport system permease protein
LTDGSAGAAVTPIADLTYRTYDGPLIAHSMRWWIVARAGLRALYRKPAFWICAFLGAGPYFMIGIALYIAFRVGAGNTNIFMGSGPGTRFAAQFYAALRMQQLFLYIIALLVGAGSVSADNQANALIVYLSKPITKTDYLLGKWMSIFLVVFAVVFVPALALYLYCLTSYISEGFLHDEPWLILRIVAASALAGAVHASLVLGFSAWCKTPRMASAVYSAMYFGSMGVAIALSSQFPPPSQMSSLQALVGHLSISGVIVGMSQNVYNVTPVIFGEKLFAPPSWQPLALLTAIMVAGGVAAARARIRAVEVIRG